MDESVIPNASYCVYEGSPKKDSPITWTSGHTFPSKKVTFYTFDGNPIVTMDHGNKDNIIQRKLDQNAPKPNPVSFRRIWWPAYDVGFGLTKGRPGYGILFHDKHGNRIGWERIKTTDQDIGSILDYDLRGSFEEPSDFSRKK